MAQKSKLIGTPNSVRVGQMPPPCWANPNFGAHHLGIASVTRLPSGVIKRDDTSNMGPVPHAFPDPTAVLKVLDLTILTSQQMETQQGHRMSSNRGESWWLTYEKRWNITIFHGKIHYFDWVIFHSYVKFSEGISHKDLDILDALPYCKNLSKNGLFDQVNLHHHCGHQLRRLGWIPRYNAHPYPGPNDVDICWWLFNHRS